MTVAGYSGDAGDAMRTQAIPNYNANGFRFSTPDSDNDANPTGNCAVIANSGWWFGWCSRNYLNRDADAIWTTPVYNVPTSRMLVKLN